jgi:hypothetical protein
MPPSRSSGVLLRTAGTISSGRRPCSTELSLSVCFGVVRLEKSQHCCRRAADRCWSTYAGDALEEGPEDVKAADVGHRLGESRLFLLLGRRRVRCLGLVLAELHLAERVAERVPRLALNLVRVDRAAAADDAVERILDLIAIADVVDDLDDDPGQVPLVVGQPAEDVERDRNDGARERGLRDDLAWRMQPISPVSYVWRGPKTSERRYSRMSVHIFRRPISSA